MGICPRHQLGIVTLQISLFRNGCAKLSPDGSLQVFRSPAITPRSFASSLGLANACSLPTHAGIQDVATCSNSTDNCQAS